MSLISGHIAGALLHKEVSRAWRLETVMTGSSGCRAGKAFRSVYFIKARPWGLKFLVERLQRFLHWRTTIEDEQG